MRDVAGRLSRRSWLSLLRFRCTQVIPLTSFTGLVAVDITQRQTDDEEQRSQDAGHTGHEVARTAGPKQCAGSACTEGGSHISAFTLLQHNQTNKANRYNKENNQKSFVHNQPVPCGFAAYQVLRPIKRDVLTFPTEAGVNTNQSE
ncbi:conserved hypothetical protein [Klebsiella variicola]|nr:conserved hypothetical protein [Klebsiella variicola]